ncbi:hypothetical protein FB451DRAFT_1411710 [Mycena latifolia]|nr:hypothetical protein FB451DRAFT_1411710 [Mycena latifolia]
MKAIASCLLLAPVLVAAVPTPDFPVTIVANIDDTNLRFNQQSLSVVGTQGDATVYGLSFGLLPATLIEDSEGYTLAVVEVGKTIDGSEVTVGYECKFGDSSAADCVKHFATAIDTQTGLPLLALQTLTVSGDPPTTTSSSPSSTPRVTSGSGPSTLPSTTSTGSASPATTSSNGGIRGRAGTKFGSMGIYVGCLAAVAGALMQL